jgi:hypothetical protein
VTLDGRRFQYNIAHLYAWGNNTQNGDDGIEINDKILMNLQLLNRAQICLFAWLCGLRSLPILSVGRSFDYWAKEEKQKYLYSIFYALDACAGGWSLNIADVYDVADLALNAAVAANAAKAAAEAAAKTTAAKNTKNAAWIAWTASDTASAIAWAARTASTVTANPDAAVNAAAWTFRASTYYDKINNPDRFSDAIFWGSGAYTRIANRDIFGKTKENDIDIIFNIISAIHNHDLAALNKDASIYGVIWNNFLEDTNNTSIYEVVWNNFLKDLNSVGCGYWARLYENLFKNKFIIKDRFIMDEEELVQRLFGVPDEVKAAGAAAAGQYLENSGKGIGIPQ